MKDESHTPIDYFWGVIKIILSKEPQGRNCYCGLWETHPDVLRKQGVPEGYCGICDCGKPGHTRHAPSGPYTASWCDEHYSEEVERARKRRREHYGRFHGIKVFFSLLYQSAMWYVRKWFRC